MNIKTLTLVNGKFQANIPTSSRNFQYGDGVFETCIIKNNKLIFWHKHFNRLILGCDRLGIANIKEHIFLKDIQKLINKNKLKNAIIKIIVSRGNSARGYRAKQASPVRVVSISALVNNNQNSNFELSICKHHYHNNPNLAQIKHCNRLENILSSLDLNTSDCLMLDCNNFVISSTCANIFIIKNNELITPDIVNCGISGTRRSVVLELAQVLNMRTQIRDVSLADVEDADDIFITNSILGIQQITQFNNKKYTKSVNIDKLRAILLTSEEESGLAIKPKTTITSFVKFIGFIVFIFALMFIYVNKDVRNTASEIVHISPNSSLSQISTKLKNSGIIHSSTYFSFLAKTLGYEQHMQAGYYLVKPNTSIVRLLDSVQKGNIIKHNITLIEGMDAKEYFQVMQNNNNLTSNISFEQTLIDADIKYPYQGMIAPDTYKFNHKSAASDIFRRANKKAQIMLAEMWANRNKSINIKTPYQAVILASLIEKEATNNAEKVKISGVFNRRLKYNMRLQTDPSVIYALKNTLGYSYQKPLKKTDLYINSPYNTYRYKGLPPTAICAISKSSLYAALHPDNSDNLYFVSKKDGNHAFSKTYKEHLANIDKYLR